MLLSQQVCHGTAAANAIWIAGGLRGGITAACLTAGTAAMMMVVMSADMRSAART